MNIYKDEYRITTLLANPQGNLGLFGALNLLQETAWSHAETIGLGFHDMEKTNTYWVLTRQSLVMDYWPRIHATIQVHTWLRPPEGAFVTREFSLFDQNGNTLGNCSTSWLALDKTTKKILPALDLAPWGKMTNTQVTNITPEKIPVSGEYQYLARYRVRNSDLDINQHVNNTKYAQWILDAIPYPIHQALQLKKYSVNFLAETHLGDKVQIDQSIQSTDPITNDSGVSIYRGVRAQDHKILFSALLEWKKK